MIFFILAVDSIVHGYCQTGEEYFNKGSLWLPEFLSQIENSQNVAEAVFRANKKVSTIFNTPKAYACLHLYGNPLLKIGEG